MAASKGKAGKGGKGKPVGYGAKGTPFYNQKNFNQSKVGQGKATAKTPVGHGEKGTPFYNLEKYNQSKVGQKKGNPNPGTKGKTIVGYGAKGKPFYNLEKFNQSKVGQGKAIAKPPNPAAGGKGLHGGLSGNKQNPLGPKLKNPSAGQRAHAATSAVGKSLAITSHPAAMPRAIAPRR